MIGTMWCSQWEWKGDVLHQHDVVIAGDFLESAAEDLVRIHAVAGEHLAIGIGDALRGFQQAFAVRIVAGPPDQRANGGLRLLARGARGFAARLSSSLSFGRVDDGIHECVSRSSDLDTPERVKRTTDHFVNRNRSVNGTGHMPCSRSVVKYISDTRDRQNRPGPQFAARRSERIV
jgi:hypothetical protein